MAFLCILNVSNFCASSDSKWFLSALFRHCIKITLHFLRFRHKYIWLNFFAIFVSRENVSGLQVTICYLHGEEKFFPNVITHYPWRYSTDSSSLFDTNMHQYLMRTRGPDSGYYVVSTSNLLTSVCSGRTIQFRFVKLLTSGQFRYYVFHLEPDLLINWSELA